jgi:hypothetical protein
MGISGLLPVLVTILGFLVDRRCVAAVEAGQVLSCLEQ